MFRIAALAAFVLTLPVAADSYKLTGENTKIEFTGTKTDGKHDGGFKTLVGAITVDGNDLTTAKIGVVIDTDSIWSDDARLTGHLKTPDFFDVKNNPKSTFKSTKIEKTATGYTIHGELMLNGKTKEIHFPATFALEDGKVTLSAKFSIDRTAFGMSYGEGKINKDVELRISLTASK